MKIIINNDYDSKKKQTSKWKKKTKELWLGSSARRPGPTCWLGLGYSRKQNGWWCHFILTKVTPSTSAGWVNPPYHLHGHGHCFKSTKETKYVEATLSNDFCWDSQLINHTKASKTLGFLRRNLKVLSLTINWSRHTKPWWGRCWSLQSYSQSWTHSWWRISTSWTQVAVQKRAAWWVVSHYWRTASADIIMAMLHVCSSGGSSQVTQTTTSTRLTIFFQCHCRDNHYSINSNILSASTPTPTPQDKNDSHSLTPFRVPGEIKRSRDLRGGRWSWTLNYAQKRSWVGRWR